MSDSPESKSGPALPLAAVVESSDDAIISKDLNGNIITWNHAAEEIFGYSAREAVGKNIRILIPQDLQHEEDEILAQIRSGNRVRHYETIRQRKDGSLLDISLSISPVVDTSGAVIGAAKIARDISERKTAERLLARAKERYETLNRIAKALSSNLDLDHVISQTTDLATKLVGAKFGAFFYNVTNPQGESYLLYALSGAPRSAFDKFGMPRNTGLFDHTFTGRGPVRVDDVRKDPRYGKSAPHYGQPRGHLPVVSYLAVPVMIGDKEVFGGLFFGHDQPGVFDEDAEELAQGIASHAAVAIENARLHQAVARELESRKAAEATKELLLFELKHRVKNMLSTINAVASQTLTEAPPAALREFMARVHSLANAHDLLTRQDWKETDVRAIIEETLLPFTDLRMDRLRLEGPPVSLVANKVLLIALTIHELATNAIKYGAWSIPQGDVEIQWELNDARTEMQLVWRERGGPPVKAPERQGFGSSLIRTALGRGGGKSTLEFNPDGLVCRVVMKL